MVNLDVLASDSKIVEREVASTYITECFEMCELLILHCQQACSLFFFVKIRLQKEDHIWIVSPEKPWTSLLRKFKLTLT